MKSSRVFIILLIVSMMLGAAAGGFVWYMGRGGILRAAQAKLTARFTPSALTIGSGETEIVTLLLQPADVGATISGVDLTFLATGAVRISDISVPETYPDGDSSLFTPIVSSVRPEISRISYVVTRPSNQLPRAVVVRIILQGGAGGSGSLALDPSKSQIVGEVDGFEYELQSVSPVTVSVKSGSSFVAPPDDGSIVSLNMKIRMQGVVGPFVRNPDVLVTVGVGSAVRALVSYPVLFHYTDEGIWEGKVAISEPPGDGVFILLKGPFHTQLRICDSQPVIGSSGRYQCAQAQISLKAGENIFDFTNVPLPVGDIRVNGGPQNGAVDANDLVYLRNNLGNTEPEVLENADVNVDGVIDTQDFSLIMESITRGYRRDE